MQIRKLSEITINKIATGEVVDRPLSVVKELVENSIDAGATEIYINMNRGGRSLISVSDNGVGISKDDLPLAVTRHATSKIMEDDISNIVYMGFRGEALASMATAARLNITSRVTEAMQGWNIKLDNGYDSLKDIDISPAPHSIGTTIEVRDLFCFMPNRVRFLKPENTEVVACAELINSLAIVHQKVKFSLIHNDKSIIDMSCSNNLEERISEVWNADFIKNSVYFETRDSGVNKIELYGYVSLPTNNRSSNSKILTFVNKRLVNDNFLNKLVRVAYFNTLPEGLSPSVILFLQMPIKWVDVNIHPNKSEVRFSDERMIREVVINSIRDAIRNVKTATPQQSFQKISADTLNNTTQLPFQLHHTSLHDRTTMYDRQIGEETQNVSNNQPRKLSDRYLGIPKFQIAAKYVVAENANGMIVVDQHAAHERIILENINKKEFKLQNLLIPLSIDFGRAKNELLMSIADVLQNIGIEIQSEDCSYIIIHSVMSFPGNIDIVSLLEDIVTDTEAYLEILNSHKDIILKKIACYSSIRAGRKLNLMEMDGLLRLIEKTDFASQCIHGRPTYLELSTQHLDKLFERI